MSAAWHHARVLLPWACLALLPVGRLSEVPIVAMALGGALLLARRGVRWLGEPGPALLAGVFACMWLPIVISLADAVRPDQTLRIALVHLRFLFAGLFVIAALDTREHWARFLRLCAWLLVFWVLDAAVQGLLGRDLLGQGATPGKLTGPFGTRSGKFGLVLAVFAPLLVEHARAAWGPRGTLAAALAVFGIVFAAGTRSGWVAAVVVAGCYWMLAWVSAGRPPWRATGIAAGVAVGLGAIGAAVSPRIHGRLVEFAHLVGSDGAWNALGHRLWIWKGTWNVFAAHPVNGVGARGMRHAFGDHVEPGDPYFFADPPILPTHPHHMVLEIASETGLVGLAGLAAATVLLIRAARRAGAAGHGTLMVPAGFALAAAAWPLNTHLATYSAFWSLVLWWLVALVCAGYGAGFVAGSGAGGGAPPARAPATRA